jgi:hypothetical protein
MADTERLRSSAARLLAMAIKAQENGDQGFAEVLTVRALQHLDDAAAGEDVVQQQHPPAKKSGE